MHHSPRFAFASLALVLAFGLAQAQTKKPEAMAAPMAIPLTTASGSFVTIAVRAARISDAMFADLAREYKIERHHLAVIESPAASKCWERLAADAESFTNQCMTAATSGEEIHYFAGSETPFVTDIKITQCGGQNVLVPQTSLLSSGFRIDMLPTLLPDGRHVMIRFNAELAEIPEGQVPLFPVTTFIAPVNDDGSKGEPIPFTQFLQQPTLTKRQFSRNFGLAVGETAIVYGGHVSRTETQVDRVPFFADLPLLGDLFEKEVEKTVSNHLVYFVTPNVVSTPTAAAPCNTVGCRTLPIPRVAPTSAPVPVVMAENAYSPVVFQAPAMPPAPPLPVAQLTGRCEVVSPAAPNRGSCNYLIPPCRSDAGDCPTNALTNSRIISPAMPPCNLPEKVQTSDSPRAVTLRCSIIKIDESFFDRADAEAWADLSPTAGNAQWKSMSDDSAQRFCKAVTSQAGGEIVSAPTLVMLEGRSASVSTSSESAGILGVGFVERAGVTVPTFHKHKECGISCEFLPTLSKDGKTCRLEMKVDHTICASNRPVPCEITIKIPATGDTPEEIRTETVQAVTGLEQRTIHTTQDIACGQCILMYLNKQETDKGTQHFAMLVTPIVTECAAQKVMPPHAPPALMKLPTCNKDGICVYPCPVGALEDRMARYRKACQDERWADARKLAAECVELDPKCFLPK